MEPRTYKTYFVKRANVVLEVSESQLDYYMSQGYDVIDEQGNVIKASVPTDLGTLQKAFVENAETIAEQRVEIEQLKTEIEQLKTELAKKSASRKKSKEE